MEKSSNRASPLRSVRNVTESYAAIANNTVLIVTQSFAKDVALEDLGLGNRTVENTLNRLFCLSDYFIYSPGCGFLSLR